MKDNSKLNKLEVFLLVCFLLAFVTQVYFRLTRSLWLDELLSFWVIDASFWKSIRRAFFFQGQSPASYVVFWFSHKLIGSSEAALRLPAFLMFLVSLMLIYRIVIRLVGQSAAFRTLLIACLCVAFNTCLDFRPYSFALMCYLASILFFLKYKQEVHGGSLFLASILFSLAIYGHPLFAVGLISFLVLFFYIPSPKKTEFNRLIFALMLLVVLVIPVLIQLQLIYSKQALYTWLPSPSLGRLYMVLAPYPIGLLVLLLGVTGAVRYFRGAFQKFNIQLAVVLLLLAVLPCIIVLITDLFGLTSVFFGRYLLYTYVFSCILLGYFSSLWISRVNFLVLCLGLQLYLVFVRQPLNTLGWREAVQSINRESTDAALLVGSGLVESNSVNWLSDPDKQAYLLAPFSYYTVNSEPTVIPSSIESAAARDDLHIKLQRAIIQNKNVNFILNAPSVELLNQCNAFLKANQYRRVEEDYFGQLRLLKYVYQF